MEGRFSNGSDVSVYGLNSTLSTGMVHFCEGSNEGFWYDKRG
jgi:hypothetical protein